MSEKKSYSVGQIIDILCGFREDDWEGFKRTVDQLRAVREYEKFEELPTNSPTCPMH